ncbi:hypothetical protein AB0E78_33250 [Streptomyces sp. NPDC032198]|uniref:hypothetical protein n=1 Tax=Streptomyces sp. NPDC032198 TaxID=3155127 RepID=UPI003402BD30
MIAFRTAIHRLDPTQGPRLIAYEPRLRTLLTTHPRGRPVDDAAACMCCRVSIRTPGAC